MAGTLHELLKREIVRERPAIVRGVATLVAIVVPTLLRWGVDKGAYGVPFITYFPAILMMAVVFGWRAALVTAIGSLALVIILFTPPAFLAIGSWATIDILALFVLASVVMIGVGHLLRVTVLETVERARAGEAFNRELQHRMRNTFQLIRALASRATRASDPAEFYRTLNGRLDALSEANRLLQFGELASCDVETLVRTAVEPFASRQIWCAGPACRVSRNAATPLMMALHELCTNASKYGALSREGGQVMLVWDVIDGAGEQRIEIRWNESGGPPVTPPTRKGVGSYLLKSHGELRAVELEYRPEGVVCRMEATAG